MAHHGHDPAATTFEGAMHKECAPLTLVPGELPPTSKSSTLILNRQLGYCLDVAALDLRIGGRESVEGITWASVA